ncbi:hypothetical protein K503DRAFT_805258 [Rhizopogon vinicolor AM-OR11-026]|uniref:Thiamine pyrophosphate enzyme TPP-binding domain-containing protein n=1 Tax=Rhizopogon vinicolor AM-OR11-026 TaxID=1314800 RepID=A0A1B7MIH9_9AGAM|nr:hypothetical protein K503DRAFT_805258 [Rhizopogon vinicolor AM-OR11-026]
MILRLGFAGTMGFGLPAAIGAKVAAVVDIDGDASFSMTAMELATASQFDIGVKVLFLTTSFRSLDTSDEGTRSVL